MDANRNARAVAAALPLGRLSNRLDGSIVTPADERYAAARRVWNGTVNEYPAAVAYCESVDDVVAAVSFARERDLAVAVRSGGHSVSGASVVSGGLVVDCSRLEWVRVDPDGRTARVGPGATWGMFDRAAQSFGLATPGGVVSDTGVAGLTLGGGTGYLSPKHGLAADNLRSIDVVTGCGERTTASPNRNEDLFWAARGGGTVGVVTAFEFDLHPLDHDVLYAESWLPLDDAADALRAYRAYQRDAPDESCVSPYFARVPERVDVDTDSHSDAGSASRSAFPSERRGDLALVLSGVYAGTPAAGRSELEPLFDRPAAFVRSAESMPYADLQSMMDDDFPEGRRYYWKSVPLADLSDDAIDELREAAERAPSELSTVVVWPMHGAVEHSSTNPHSQVHEDAVEPSSTSPLSQAREDAVERVPDSAGPIAGRDAFVVVNVEAAWDDPAATTANVEWVRETCRRFRDLDSTPGSLPNFAGGGDADADDVYAEHAERLRAVRERHDPDGVFAYERA